MFGRQPRLGRSATLILPRLYLSDAFTARQESTLTELGITHVITAMEHALSLPKLIADEHRLHVSISDRSDVNLLRHLDATTEFISAALSENEDNKVLVHCVQGISRSATIVCAYVIATSEPRMTAQEALSFVQLKRTVVCPNIGFRTQLEMYSDRFNGTKRSPKAEKIVLRRAVLGTMVMERIHQLRAAQNKNTEVS